MTSIAASLPVPRRAAPEATSAPTRIPLRQAIAFMTMCFGMFMAILDIQIVSSSLAEIQAGLSASADEIPWVQTAYLIAEVIAIPLSGYLIFKGPQQKFVAPVIGLIATLAPTIGPTVGAYLTDAMSWHWLFFINVIPGVVVTIVTIMLVDFDKPDLALFDNFDWYGLLAMAGFLGALEYVLEEGPRNDWFEDQAIVMLAIVSAVSAVVFFIRVLTARAPIVDLRAFANRNFAVGSLFSFVLGIGLYGLTYLYPVYLAQVRGYDALMIGQTMFVSGLVMFASAPIAGQLNERVDPRFVLVAGFVFFAIGTWQMTYVTSDWDFWELLWPQVFRGVGLMFAIVPVTNTALGTLAPERVKNASGLFNLMRNLGGAIGLAAINTALNDRMDLHLARLHDSVNWSSVPAVETLSNLTARFQGSDAQAMALKQMMGIVRQQAAVMSYADLFLMMTALFLALAAVGIIMRRPQKPAEAAAGH